MIFNTLLSRLSVRAKLLFSFAVTLLLCFIVLGITAWRLSGINEGVKEVAHELGQGLSRTNALTADNTQIRFICDRSRPKAEWAEGDRDAFIEHSKRLDAEIGNLKAQDFPQEEGRIISLREQYMHGTADFIKAIDGKDVKAANDIYTTAIRPAYNQIMLDLNSLAKKQTDSAVESIKRDANVRPALLMILAGGVVALAAGLFLALSLSSYIGYYLDKSIRLSKAIARGDLTREIRVRATDDFAQLAHSIEDMRRSLLGIAQSITHATGGVEERIDHVLEIAGKLSSSASGTQGRAVTVAAASDEMVSTTSDIAKNCSHASDTANDSNKALKDGIGLIAKAIDGIQQNLEGSARNAELIHKLADQTQSISAIVSTIDEIAQQTNLLALNAAIEAARAGAAGKGFAVVADEVRTLANRTSKSTSEIVSMVTRVQQDANNANESITASLEDMKALASSAGTIREVMDATSGRVGDVAGEIAQIATAAEEQTTATSEISTNMQGITDAAKDLASGVGEVEDSIRQARSLMDELNGAVGRLRISKDEPQA